MVMASILSGWKRGELARNGAGFSHVDALGKRQAVPGQIDVRVNRR
jgi:hypothetical protein